MPTLEDCALRVDRQADHTPVAHQSLNNTRTTKEYQIQGLARAAGGSKEGAKGIASPYPIKSNGSYPSLPSVGRRSHTGVKCIRTHLTSRVHSSLRCLSPRHGTSLWVALWRVSAVVRMGVEPAENFARRVKSKKVDREKLTYNSKQTKGIYIMTLRVN